MIINKLVSSEGCHIHFNRLFTKVFENWRFSILFILEFSDGDEIKRLE